MDDSRNSRGQLNDIVQMSVEAGKRDEDFFQNFIENKYKIQLIKKGQFKHYDFKLNKIHKIEYKCLHYSLDVKNNSATSINDNSKIIKNVMIGTDKSFIFITEGKKKYDVYLLLFQ